MTGHMEGVFYFDPDDLIYKDHFPGRPVVPGSVIIHAFLKAMEKQNRFPDSISLEQFRFKTFINPGEYRYTITLDDEKARCILYDRDKAAVTGVIRS